MGTSMLRSAVAAAVLVAADAAGVCSGSGDPSGPGCYRGSAAALGVTETLQVNVKSFAAGAGTADVFASGVRRAACQDRHFQKQGQAVTVDLSDCLPRGVALSSVMYCSDSDTLEVTVTDSVIPAPLTATLSKVACPTATGTPDVASACTGAAPVPGPGCYTGSVAGLSYQEDLTMRISSVAAGGGEADILASGDRAVSCPKRTFQQAGQAIVLDADAADCPASGLTLTSMEYCSDSDSFRVTAIDPLQAVPVTATLLKAECGSIQTTVCTGTGAPVAPRCYEGTANQTESLKLKVKTFSAGQGTLDFVELGGKTVVSCLDRPFTKTDQSITISTGDCLPSGISLTSIQYCSDSDEYVVEMKDSIAQTSVAATLKQTTCSTGHELVV